MFHILHQQNYKLFESLSNHVYPLILQVLLEVCEAALYKVRIALFILFDLFFPSEKELKEIPDRIRS